MVNHSMYVHVHHQSYVEFNIDEVEREDEMKYTFFGDDQSIVYVESDQQLITDTQSALDLMATVQYEKTAAK